MVLVLRHWTLVQMFSKGYALAAGKSKLGNRPLRVYPPSTQFLPLCATSSSAMSEIDAVVVAPAERLVAMLPFGVHPLGRAAWGGAIGYAAATALKPSMSYLPDGRARNWIVTHPDDAEAAVFPAAGFVVVPALLLGLFL